MYFEYDKGTLDYFKNTALIFCLFAFFNLCNFRYLKN